MRRDAGRITLVALAPILALVLMCAPVLAVADSTDAPVVVIDAGHQKKANNKLVPIGPGSDEKRAAVSSGTRGKYTGIPEYKITLQVAKRLSKSLKKAGYTVYMVRTKNDVDIPNKERAEYANKKKADLVIRLHCDGIDGSSSIRGFLTLTPAKNKWTKKIYKESLKASKAIHNAALKATGAPDRGISKRGDLVGFNYSKVPVTLLEMGVMTNEKDDRLLASADYQKKIVKGVVKGVKAYFKK
jgi:N-acetylmuramoyl-L-alanine amidase